MSFQCFQIFLFSHGDTKYSSCWWRHRSACSNSNLDGFSSNFYVSNIGLNKFSNRFVDKKKKNISHPTLNFLLRLTEFEVNIVLVFADNRMISDSELIVFDLWKMKIFGFSKIFQFSCADIKFLQSTTCNSTDDFQKEFVFLFDWFLTKRRKKNTEISFSFDMRICFCQSLRRWVKRQVLRLNEKGCIYQRNSSRTFPLISFISPLNSIRNEDDRSFPIRRSPAVAQ